MPLLKLIEIRRRRRSLIALEATDGIVIVAENPSRTLYKISEIYDRIAFAGVGNPRKDSFV